MSPSVSSIVAPNNGLVDNNTNENKLVKIEARMRNLASGNLFAIKMHRLLCFYDMIVIQ